MPDLDRLPGWRTLPGHLLTAILDEVDETSELADYVADELADRAHRGELARRGVEGS